MTASETSFILFAIAAVVLAGAGLAMILPNETGPLYPGRPIIVSRCLLNGDLWKPRADGKCYVGDEP